MKVRALLKTPLYRRRKTADDSPYLAGDVTEVRGKAEVRDGGLDIKVAGLFGDKGEAVDSTVKRIFLPLAKIDYYIVDDK
jgi:hypothetical protein